MISRRFSRTIPLVTAALLAAAPAHALDAKGWSTASDVGAGALAAFALANPLLVHDDHGLYMAAGSMALGAGLTEVLSLGIKEERPDGSGRDSFPSAHAGLAFSAAATLQRRYGWQVGIPAQLVAVFVGTARVQARKHHWYDVVAGGAIGEASGFLITKPLNSGARLTPWADSHGGGVSLAMNF